MECFTETIWCIKKWNRAVSVLLITDTNWRFLRKKLFKLSVLYDSSFEMFALNVLNQTWRRRWYLRTLCIGTTSRSLSVNFPLLALLEHSWNKYNKHIYITVLVSAYQRACLSFNIVLFSLRLGSTKRQNNMYVRVNICSRLFYSPNLSQTFRFLKI